MGEGVPEWARVPCQRENRGNKHQGTAAQSKSSSTATPSSCTSFAQSHQYAEIVWHELNGKIFCREMERFGGGRRWHKVKVVGGKNRKLLLRCAEERQQAPSYLSPS